VKKHFTVTLQRRTLSDGGRQSSSACTFADCSSCYGDWRLYFWRDYCNPQNEPVLVSTDPSFTNRSSGPIIPQVTCVHFSRGPLSFSRSPASITHILMHLVLPVLLLFVASSVRLVVYVLYMHLLYGGSAFRIHYSSYVEHHTAVWLLFTPLHFCWKRLERKEQFYCLPLFYLFIYVFVMIFLFLCNQIGRNMFDFEWCPVYDSAFTKTSKWQFCRRKSVT
jgi:hypothetical protein